MIKERIRVSGGYYVDMVSGKVRQYRKMITLLYRDEKERDKKLAKDKNDAENKFKEEVKNTKVVTTFYDLVLLRQQKISVKPRTIASDSAYVEELLGIFGKMKISDMNSQLLEDYFNKLAENGYSQSYQHRRFKFLKKYLRFAVQQGIIMFNPILTLSYAPYSKEAIKMPDPETVSKVKKLFYEIFRETEKENRASMNWIKFRVQLLLIADGCLRSAELFGLTWAEISLDSKYMMVKNTACKLTKKEAIRQGIPTGTIDTTKTISSIRKCPLSQITIDYLKLYKAKTDKLLVKKNARNKNMYVFFSHINIEGKDVSLVDASGLGSRISNFCKKYNIKHISPHEIRKACYSIRLNADLPQQYCEYILGHSPGKANLVYITDMESSAQRNHKKWEAILTSMIQTSVSQK